MLYSEAMTAYDLLRFVHVLFAVTAVGANITYSVWLAHAAREPEHLDYTLRGIAALDSRVANPSYIMLLVTGVTLGLQGNIPCCARRWWRCGGPGWRAMTIGRWTGGRGPWASLPSLWSLPSPTSW